MAGGCNSSLCGEAITFRKSQRAGPGTKIVLTVSEAHGLLDGDGVPGQRRLVQDDHADEHVRSDVHLIEGMGKRKK